MHPLDHEGRALWHLELLGCFDPGDAVAPWVPPGAEPERYCDDAEEDDSWLCTHCGGSGYGDDDDWLEDGWYDPFAPCGACHGTGERRHQWVF